MPELIITPSGNLPPPLKYQLLTAVRYEWPQMFAGPALYWDFTDKPYDPVNVMLTEGDVLLAHAEVNRRLLTHAGQTFDVCGLSAVLTVPPYRGRGYGTRITEEATAYIRGTRADLAMLFCLEDLRPFYDARGWHRIQTEIRYGDPPQRDNGLLTLYMLFLSEKGRAARPTIEGRSIHVGPHTW